MRDGLYGSHKRFVISMYGKTRVVDVVEARPAQLFVIDIKAQWFDEMERTTSVRTQPKNIACVGWYLGMNQNDVKNHR